MCMRKKGLIDSNNIFDDEVELFEESSMLGTCGKTVYTFKSLVGQRR